MTGVDVDPLTIRVDLRSAWSSVRDQGGRSACLACAASDAHAYCRGRAQPLSAEFLFYHAGQRMPHKSVALGLTYDAVDLALQADGQPDEAEWPYTTTEPNPWTPPAVSQRWHGDLKPPGADIPSLVSAIEKRQPVLVGLRLTPEFMGLNSPPYIVSGRARGFGGHAVLAVGLADHQTNGELILVRNSWGANWGGGGCAWLTTDHITDNLIGYRVVSPISAP